MRFVCALVVLACCAQGCSTQECTLVGCVNGVDVDLRTAAGTWNDGRYTASFATPQGTYQCSLQVPVDLPIAPTWSKPLACTSDGEAGGPGGRFTANFQRYTACGEPRGIDPKSPECERQVDQFMLRARFDELTPETIGIRVERDGASMFEELRTLRYESWYPNGPECAPECRSSDVEVTMR